MSTSNSNLPYKLCILGDGGVGKTALLKNLLTNQFEKKYVATLGVEVHTLTFQTNVGDRRFNVWDTAGQEKFGGLRDGYYIQAQCGIVMFDVTSNITFKNVVNWMRDFHNVVGEAPVIVIGNKVDIKDSRKVFEKDVLEKLGEVKYYEMSVKEGLNMTKPFLTLLKQLENNPNINLVGKDVSNKVEVDLGSMNLVKEIEVPGKEDTF